jgi:hypothetical protein
MSGYLHRLVASQAPMSTALPWTPTLRSTSPIVAADQRLSLDGFGDTPPSFSAELEEASEGESQTPQSFMPAAPLTQHSRAAPPMPSRAPAVTLQRRATAAAAAVAPTMAAPVARANLVIPLSRPAPAEPSGLDTAQTPVLPPAAPRFGIAAPVPAAEQQALEPAPAPSRRPLSATVGPEPTGPPGLVEARPRPSFEPIPPLRVRALPPDPTPQNTNNSGAIGAAKPAALLRQGPPPKAPRSAAEASVIGPLDRPGRVGALLHLRLR